MTSGQLVLLGSLKRTYARHEAGCTLQVMITTHCLVILLKVFFVDKLERKYYVLMFEMKLCLTKFATSMSPFTST